MRELPMPSFYDAGHAALWSYHQAVEAVRASAEDWKRQHSIHPAGEDSVRIELLWVDLQRDFCHPDGALFVAGESGDGAVADNDRIVRFLYRNLESITSVTLTLDSHLPHQIFFPSFWTDGHGGPLAANRLVTAAEVRRGEVAPKAELAWWLCDGDREWLNKQVQFYCDRLEEEGRYQLFLWPYHCLIGSEGQTAVGVVQEARLFHAFTRGAPSHIAVKGDNPLTENYSALSPEVLERHDGGTLAQRNDQLIERLLGADALVVAGQAASHCVRSTVDDLVSEIASRADCRTKIYLLEDCMSSVVIRDPASPESKLFDFTKHFEQAKRAWREAGVHIVRSTEPMSSWPGL